MLARRFMALGTVSPPSQPRAPARRRHVLVAARERKAPPRRRTCLRRPTVRRRGERARRWHRSAVLVGQRRAGQCREKHRRELCHVEASSTPRIPSFSRVVASLSKPLTRPQSGWEKLTFAKFFVLSLQNAHGPQEVAFQAYLKRRPFYLRKPEDSERSLRGRTPGHVVGIPPTSREWPQAKQSCCKTATRGGRFAVLPMSALLNPTGSIKTRSIESEFAQNSRAFERAHRSAQSRASTKSKGHSRGAHKSAQGCTPRASSRRPRCWPVRPPASMPMPRHSSLVHQRLPRLPLAFALAHLLLAIGCEECGCD